MAIAVEWSLTRQPVATFHRHGAPRRIEGPRHHCVFRANCFARDRAREPRAEGLACVRDLHVPTRSTVAVCEGLDGAEGRDRVEFQAAAGERPEHPEEPRVTKRLGYRLREPPFAFGLICVPAHQGVELRDLVQQIVQRVRLWAQLSGFHRMILLVSSDREYRTKIRYGTMTRIPIILPRVEHPDVGPA